MKERQEFFSRCKCEKKHGLFIDYFNDENETVYFGILLSPIPIIDKLKIIWSILTGQEYLFEDVVMDSDECLRLIGFLCKNESIQKKLVEISEKEKKNERRKKQRKRS